MSTPIIRMKAPPRTVIKGKMDVRFPANVSAESPILLDKIGGAFAFSFDMNAVIQSVTFAGFVSGPSSAVDGNIPQFDGTTGKKLKDGKAAPTGDIVGTSDTQTLTNKTLTAPAISSPTGLVKSDVGLGNVDNTSDATKNAASAALTNKDLTSGTNTFPTFNQNTTGSAAKLTTARNIDGQAFDGTANITVIAPGTHAATSKTTPVDADELPLVDSAASNVLKKLTWANLKAALKTYFDSLSTTLTNKTIDTASNTFKLNGATFGTATQATAALNSLVGDTGSGGTKGLVPAPASGDASGGKYLKADGTWAVPPGGAGGREILTANRTYYVDATNGSDSNNGLASGSGHAFATIQKAVDTVYALDLSIYNVIIQLADGTYSGSVAFKGGDFVGKGSVSLNGNATTPTNVVVSIPNSYGAFRVQDGVTVTISNLQIAPQAGSAAQNILIQNFATVSISGIDFAASGRAHIEALNFANVIFAGAWTISGDAPMHVTLDAASNLTWSSQTVTATGGTRTFSTCFLNVANRSGALIVGPTITGTFSGVRWLASLNGTIKTNGAGANTNVPGSTNGTASTGGQTA